MAGIQGAFRKKLCPCLDNCDLCKLLPDSVRRQSGECAVFFIPIHSRDL